jgi:hypothetical protein
MSEPDVRVCDRFSYEPVEDESAAYAAFKSLSKI